MKNVVVQTKQQNKGSNNVIKDASHTTWDVRNKRSASCAFVFFSFEKLALPLSRSQIKRREHVYLEGHYMTVNPPKVLLFKRLLTDSHKNTTSAPESETFDR
jgi:hypothetical protein